MSVHDRDQVNVELGEIPSGAHPGEVRTYLL
jgi:hypothetical protein